MAPIELDSDLDVALEKIDEIAERIPSELDHTRALLETLEYHEQLDRLINSARARRNDSLEMLEHYRAGLGQRLRTESDKIIDAAYTELETQSPQIEAPSIVATDDEGTS